MARNVQCSSAASPDEGHLGAPSLAGCAFPLNLPHPTFDLPGPTPGLCGRACTVAGTVLAWQLTSRPRLTPFCCKTAAVSVAHAAPVAFVVVPLPLLGHTAAAVASIPLVAHAGCCVWTRCHRCALNVACKQAPTLHRPRLALTCYIAFLLG